MTGSPTSTPPSAITVRIDRQNAGGENSRSGGYSVDFAEQMERANATAPIQVITDGSEPNTANFVQGMSKDLADLANAASGG